MKRVLRRTLKKLTRTKFSAQGDALRAEFRAEIAQKVREGRADEVMRESLGLLGIKAESGARPKMVFGAKR